jgi:hypothetical protein
MQLLRWLSEVVLSRYFSRRDRLVLRSERIWSNRRLRGAHEAHSPSHGMSEHVSRKSGHLNHYRKVRKDSLCSLQRSRACCSFSSPVDRCRARPFTQSGAAHECTRKLHCAHRCRCTIGDLDVRGVHRCPARALGPARRTPRFCLIQMFFKRNIERVWHPTVESLVQIA